MDTARDSNKDMEISSILSRISEEDAILCIATGREDFLHEDVLCLKEILPKSEHEVLAVANNIKNLGCFRYSLLLRIALSGLSLSNGWIHYSIGESLYKAFLSGRLEIRMAIIGHIQLATQVLTGRSALARCCTILAHTLQHCSPRDSIRLAIEAASYGALVKTEFIVDALSKLDCNASLSGYIDLEAAIKISSFIGLPFNLGYKVTRVDTAQSVSKRIVAHSAVSVFPRPKGSSEHYIFSVAEKQLSQPSIYLYEFANPTFSFDNLNRGLEQFYLFDEGDNCVVEFSKGISPFKDPPLSLDKPVAILADQLTAGLNICHFLLDSISRIYLYEEGLGRNCLFILPQDHEYYRQVFSMLGLSDRLLILDFKRGSVSAPAIVVSSNIKQDYRHPAHYCAGWALDYLRSRLSRNIHLRAGKQRRIAISRSDAKGRKILNWEDVQTLLHKYSFDEVILSDLSFREQVSLFSEAEIVLGVHGAGLTNILFAPSSTTVIEILPPLVATPAYWMLASSIGQEYYSLLAEDPELPVPDYRTWKHDASFNERDVIVPIDKLKALLTVLCSQ